MNLIGLMVGVHDNACSVPPFHVNIARYFLWLHLSVAFTKSFCVTRNWCPLQMETWKGPSVTGIHWFNPVALPGPCFLQDAATTLKHGKACPLSRSSSSVASLRRLPRRPPPPHRPHQQRSSMFTPDSCNSSTLECGTVKARG